MSRQEVVAYNPVKAALADLEHKYKAVVFDVSTPAGMSTAKAAYKDINAYSIMLEAARVKEKADSLTYGRFVDSEAKRIADQLDALRLPIKNQIDEVAKAEQRAREAAIKEAQDRIIAEHDAAKAAEEKRMAEQRAEIARQQAEIARAQREAEEEARTSRAKIEQEERAARLIREEADRAARREREAAEAEAKKVRDAEEARLKAERDRIDAEARALAEAKRQEQQRIDDAARKVREEAEAKMRAEQQAEADRQFEAERKRQFAADTEDFIRQLRRRIAGSPVHAGIAAAIDEYLAQKVPA
jgi:fused signal recognition particle receptor